MGMGTPGSIGGYGDTRLNWWVWGHQAQLAGMGTPGSIGEWGHQAQLVGMGTPGSIGEWGHQAQLVGMGTPGSIGSGDEARLAIMIHACTCCGYIE